jgi:type VI secretion system VasI family protein
MIELKHHCLSNDEKTQLTRQLNNKTKLLPSSDLEGKYHGYRSLTYLDDQNKEYSAALEKYQQLLFPDTGAWNLTKYTSDFDDSETVILELKSTGRTTNESPTLILSCNKNKTSVRINTHVIVDNETVIMRLDTRKATYDQWDISNSYNVISFQGDGSGLIKRLIVHKKLLVGFSEFGGEVVSTEFDLHGLNAAIKPLSELCR